MPVSAVTGFQLDVLADVLVSHLPPGRPLYPDGELTDEPEQQLVAELIREAILEGVRDELPHSIAVLVEEMGPREGRPDLIDVYAVMYVERPSQKAIVIGAKGARLKEVGSRARQQIEALLGSQGVPGSADQGGQGLAARPQAAAPPRLLRLTAAAAPGRSAPGHPHAAPPALQHPRVPGQLQPGQVTGSRRFHSSRYTSAAGPATVQSPGPAAWPGQPRRPRPAPGPSAPIHW